MKQDKAPSSLAQTVVLPSCAALLPLGPSTSGSCVSCAECGWVCQDHPDSPWEHDNCGAPGVPCACNPRGKVNWQEVYPDSDSTA